jgi:2-keto-4-pentenoate hydratase
MTEMKHEVDTRGESPAHLARLLRDARQEGRALSGGADGPQLTLRQAYLVQDQLTSLHLLAGRRAAGYKLGYTSLVMRRQMGISEPNFGPLYHDMLVESGATVDGLLQPRLEPEIAVVLGEDLWGAGLLLHEVARAVADVRGCLEIVDSVWRDYRFSMAQNTADGSSAAGVVLGGSLGVDPLECHRVSATLVVDGQTVATATGTAASGHPLHGLSWLCARLAERGERLRAGDVVITGGMTAAIPLAPGSRVEGIYDSGVAVSVRRAVRTV